MKIIIAPDSFKESLPAPQVAQALARGFQRALPQADCVTLPIGDGGEGTIQTLADHLQLPTDQLTTLNALGQQQNLSYALDGKTALFEVAGCVGLADIPQSQRQPLNLTTRGVGLAIRQLVERGVTDFVIGVGGTGTNDAGLGLAQGLGYRFLDQDGKLIQDLPRDMNQIARVDAGEVVDLSGVTIRVLTDVRNPLCGLQGASQVFGPQKGLAAPDIRWCDQAFERFYQTFAPEVLTLPGAGAGGGLAAGLVAFSGARLVSGIDAVLDRLDFEELAADADLVVVGEGQMDRQSLQGKAPVGIAKRTPAGVPVIAICGSLAQDLPAFPQTGITAAFSIISRLASKEATLAQAAENLEETAANLGFFLASQLNRKE